MGFARSANGQIVTAARPESQRCNAAANFVLIAIGISMRMH
jgi:hypothetical protein